jgi:hypothetical protein
LKSNYWWNELQEKYVVLLEFIGEVLWGLVSHAT